MGFRELPARRGHNPSESLPCYDWQHNADPFRAPITLGIASLVTAKIPQFLALGWMSTVVMQTERMFDVKARMVLVLAQASEHHKQHIQICLVLVLPSLHRGSGISKNFYSSYNIRCICTMNRSLGAAWKQRM